MARRSLVPASMIEWHPDFKEVWHYNFEKEPVNDVKWSCIVTAAIPAEAQDEECINVYTQCINTGLRKAVKVISMADVIKLLKESTTMNINKKEDKNLKPEKQERKSLKPYSFRSSQIIELAVKFALFSDLECQLPPDLMAAVLKYMILHLKEENCWQKRIDAVRQRKNRERNIKAKFIRQLKPYEMSQEERKSIRRASANILDSEKPINDELLEGPDLYILLTDFYDLSIFPELLKINVPFLAFLKIVNVKVAPKKQSSSISVLRSDPFGKKKNLINSFWEQLKEECFSVEKMNKFKDIAVLQYNAPAKPTDPSPKYYRVIFNEMTWMQYSAYRIYKQHQKYLRELYVHRLILSLEPLDLSRCDVYNKLCDALITGEPLTPLLVLYAIIEQVVAGVPETESTALEYEPRLNNFFFVGSNLTNPEKASKSIVQLVTPCQTCRDKKYESECDKLKKTFSDTLHGQKGEWAEPSEKSLISPQIQIEGNSYSMSEQLGITDSSESIISEFLIDQVMSEKITERKMQKEKMWKTPSLCFYGDSLFLQTYFCDPRLLDSESIIDRFLKKTDIFQIWAKYPELPSGERAFYNFHFFSFWKMSGESQEILKLKIYFTILMKSIAIKKSYLFKGEEDSLSEMISSGNKERIKLSRVKFATNSSAIEEEDEEDFNKFFLKTFKDGLQDQDPEIEEINDENEDHKKDSEATKEYPSLHKVKAQFSVKPPGQSSSNKLFFMNLSEQVENGGKENFYCLKKKLEHENIEEMLEALHSILDCPEISNLAEFQILTDKEEYMLLIEDFKYYEKLKSTLMIQRLLEAQDGYNTIQCSYFYPTDTIVIIMYNDFDHRGIFYNKKSEALLTPVSFRDFYHCVYPEIGKWLENEWTEYSTFVAEMEEKLKAEQEKKDFKYLTQLKKLYCEMNEQKRKDFLESEVEDQSEPEVYEKELGDLPVKPKFFGSNKISFRAMNFSDVRVEANQKSYEFHSLDGTEVSVDIDSWLYSRLSLLKVKIKKSRLVLHYNHWLGEEKINPSFTLKTISDMIIAFDREDEEEEGEKEEEEAQEPEEMYDSTYQMKISWPTGLLIQPISLNSDIYIKQGYIKHYRRGWDIEEETSRCFLRNGQVIIFKENGCYDILCGNGTKYIFYEAPVGPKYDIVSTTGEIWEVRTKGPCRYRRKLIGTNKILIGVDLKNQEVFYKREDGVCFMLWPNGVLVTDYPDGTKITSTPDFEEKEVTVEWTEEEKMLSEVFEAKQKSEISFQDRRSHTILRNSSAPISRSLEGKSFVSEGFVSVSCAYLMEHPKYASVYFNTEDSSIKIGMPEQVSVFIHPNGKYEVQQCRDFLNVSSQSVEFYTACHDCKNRSTATLNKNWDEVLWKFVDFFKKTFFVHRNGNTKFQDYYMETDEDKDCNDNNVDVDDDDADDDSSDSKNIRTRKKSKSTQECPTGHAKKMSSGQRCFAFGRDLSGVEFIHADNFGYYCCQLPEETCFDIDTDDPLNSSYSFSSPYYKVGYEKWVMEYENNENSRPTNLKKKDLKELGTKEIPKNLFKYPFPEQYTERRQTEKFKRNTNMPKIIVGRTVYCLAQEPSSVISELQKYVMAYQKRAQDICEKYKTHKTADGLSKDSRHVEMRLRKIALTLNQSLHMYPHLCTQLPSTEKDIHYFGHFINSMEGLKSHFQDQTDLLPDCKQIPKPLPRVTNFPCISEENETPDDT